MEVNDEIKSEINEFHESLFKKEQERLSAVEQKLQTDIDLKNSIQALVSLVDVSGERVFTSILKPLVQELASSYDRLLMRNRE